MKSLGKVADLLKLLELVKNSLKENCSIFQPKPYLLVFYVITFYNIFGEEIYSSMELVATTA